MITGANGHLGRQLIARLLADHEVVAAVRSDRARQTIVDAGLKPEIRVIDYTDASAVAEAGAGCDAVVHLVGIIKESKQNTFEMAHEAPCQALVDAGLAASRIVCLGVIGSDRDSANHCLRSRAAAEDILLGGPVPATILRVPMVIGPEDYASRSLANNGRANFAVTFRAASREQPIAAESVLDAIVAALSIDPAHRVIELGGPENLSRRDLIRRAGAVFGNRPSVLSLPIWLGWLVATLLEWVSGSPPVTRSMLGVLDHDDLIDNGPALNLLRIELEPLDVTLQRCITAL
jgi:NADH dehydrogenase